MQMSGGVMVGSCIRSRHALSLVQGEPGIEIWLLQLQAPQLTGLGKTHSWLQEECPHGEPHEVQGSQWQERSLYCPHASTAANVFCGALCGGSRVNAATAVNLASCRACSRSCCCCKTHTSLGLKQQQCSLHCHHCEPCSDMDRGVHSGGSVGECCCH